MNKTITISGYYGAGNLGDDLMLSGLVDHLLAAPETTVNVLVTGDSATAIAPRERLNVMVLPRGRLAQLCRVVPVLRRSDWLIWGGGTCFTDTAGDGSFKLFLLGSLLGCKLAYIAVGIGQLSRKSRIFKTKCLLRLSRLVTFRDQESFQLAKQLLNPKHYHKLHKTEDLCYLALGEPAPLSASESADDRKTWVVSVRPLEQFLPTEVLPSFWNNWKAWLKQQVVYHQPKRVVFLVIEEGRDRSVSEECCSYLASELGPNLDCEFSIAEHLSSEDKCRTLSTADQVVAMRLHACLVAGAAEVPTFGIAYCDKLTYYFDSIGSTAVRPLRSWIDSAEEISISPSPASNVLLDVRRPAALKNIELFLPLL